MAGLIEKPRREKNAITDERVKLTNELIESIRLLKMYAWEDALKDMILELRAKENTNLAKLHLIDSATRAMGIVSVLFALLFNISVYV